MSESRDHKCPRCGGYLATVTVRVPVTKHEIVDLDTHHNGFMEFTRYEDREEVADCVRCTGGY